MKTDTSVAQHIRDDHKKIQGLFSQLEALEVRSPERTLAVARELWAELELHSRLEEELLYPALDAYAGSLDPKMPVERARLEHESARKLVARMRELGPQDAQFGAYLEELRQAVRQHIEDEERVLLVEAEQKLGELSELESRWRSRRAELLENREFQDAARPELAQNPNGGEQKRTERRA
jgi:hemerythrin-like domain-containing protein